jgi:hypothetical protein
MPRTIFPVENRLTRKHPPASRWTPAGVGRSGGSAPGRVNVELVRLVVDLSGNLAELVAVGSGVVDAEQEFAAAGEHNADIGLRATTVTAVDRGKWSRWRNGTCHAYLQQSVARIPSGPSLARIDPHYACSTGIQACVGRENAHRRGTF